MAGVTLDAGPLIGFERRDRRIEAWVAEATDRGVLLAVPTPVLAEVWRGGPRSARLARALRFCAVVDLDEATAKHAGELLWRTRSTQMLDAMVVAAAAARSDALLTSDPDDMGPLALAANVTLIAF